MEKQTGGNKSEKLNELGRKFSDATIFLHERIAQKVGLSGADHKYLGLIMQNGPMTAGRLSVLSGLTTGAVTGLIDRLEKKKLVKREFDKEDRRKVLIVPEYENANKLLGPVFGALQKKVEALFSRYTDSEIAVIEKYLNDTIEMINDFSEKLNN